MKIRPVGVELFCANRRTDRHDEANSRFSQFCEKRLKITKTVCCSQNILRVPTITTDTQTETRYPVRHYKVLSDVTELHAPMVHS